MINEHNFFFFEDVTKNDYLKEVLPQNIVIDFLMRKQKFSLDKLPNKKCF
ncbi:hypothetical protein M153_9500011770 [Pseudoloma neurophilia]|uniref:Uncharacterized protein n=1 Tax=Pseudoloma neurophilia TaxID=146866 RepID=A0A0R0M0I7_9MICR|nr:hypothetical protein M153_9500011770 [Pseudoloma neurophilia]